MSGGARGRAIDVLRVVSAAGDLLVVESASPIPIGTRVSVRPACIGVLEPGAEPLLGKVIDVRRAADAYSVTVRLHSLTRAQREAIAIFTGDPAKEAGR